MTSPKIQNFFGGGAGKYAKFENIGDTITGTILEVHEPENSTDPKGVVKTDKKGRPLQQIRIDLQTDLRSDDIEYDDGMRTVYVQSWMTDAISDALRRAGAQVPEAGGKLTITLSELEPNPGLNPSKKYKAVYEKPTATEQFFDNGAAEQNQEPAEQPLPLKPAAISQDAWNSMPDNVKRNVAATMGAMATSVSDKPPF